MTFSPPSFIIRSVKNLWIKLLLACWRREKNCRDTHPRLLIVSTTGLGDSLWGTPAVRALRKKYPNAYIGLLTSPMGEQVFRHNPNLNALFVIPSSPLFFFPKLVRLLRAERFDTAYIFHTSQRVVLPAVFLGGPSQIVGTRGINKGLDSLLTSSFPQGEIHEIERRLQIVGCVDPLPHMELFLTEEENAVAFDYLGEERPLIGLHPGAQNQFKQWEPQSFVALGARLAKEKGAKILVTGSASEKGLAKKIARDIPGAVSVAGKLAIRPLAALLEKLDCLITNDTGPLHLAIAMGTPTCSLFAPTDSKICGPYQVSEAVVIQKSQSCLPCLRKKCLSPFCLRQISPSMVYERIDAHFFS